MRVIYSKAPYLYSRFTQPVARGQYAASGELLIIKLLFTHPLANPKQNAEAILKTYQLFIIIIIIIFIYCNWVVTR